MINIAVKLFEINGLQHTICSAKFIRINTIYCPDVCLECPICLQDLAAAAPDCLQYKCCILQTKCWFILTEVDRVVIDGN